MRSNTRLTGSLLAALITLPMAAALGQELGEMQCGSLVNPVGPVDYTLQGIEGVRLTVTRVEENHLNEDVQSLRGGQTGVGPMGDLDYILRAIPNHPQALMLVTRYQAEGGSRGGFRTAECYYDRALRFTPNDPTVHLLYAIYLARSEQSSHALKEYEVALALSPDYVEAHYNLGLLLVKLGRLDEAKAHAEKAYALGYPLQGLRRQLIRLNAWPESP